VDTLIIYLICGVLGSGVYLFGFFVGIKQGKVIKGLEIEQKELKARIAKFKKTLNEQFGLES